MKSNTFHSVTYSPPFYWIWYAVPAPIDRVIDVSLYLKELFNVSAVTTVQLVESRIEFAERIGVDTDAPAR